MITKVWNDGHVFYQTAVDDESMANESIVIHRDNGGTLVLDQAGQTIVMDLHRSNIKEFKAALDQALALSEAAARKK